MFKKALKILEATVGLESNRKELLPHLPLKREVPSLLTDFRDVVEIPYSKSLDGYVKVEESEAEPFYEWQGQTMRFRGPFLKLTQEASDLRFSLWGNQGFLYRFILYLLEKKHKIYNFHACALYRQEKDEFYVIIGGAGSGKTVYLLSGLAKGLRLFSTETVHFHLEGSQLTWFMGSLVDNVRWGTLIHDFPQFLPDIETPEEKEEWQRKVALDLAPYRATPEKLINPNSVIIVFPRIEEGRKGFVFQSVKDIRKAAKAVFDNISQKVTETVVLYDCLPFLGLEEKEMAQQRLEVTYQLIQHKTIAQIASVLSNPEQCWGDILR